MSPKAESTWTMLQNAFIGMIVTLFILFGSGAWARKESTEDHARDLAVVSAKLDRVLDAVCGQLPPDRARVCKEGAK